MPVLQHRERPGRARLHLVHDGDVPLPPHGNRAEGAREGDTQPRGTTLTLTLVFRLHCFNFCLSGQCCGRRPLRHLLRLLQPLPGRNGGQGGKEEGRIVIVLVVYLLKTISVLALRK